MHKTKCDRFPILSLDCNNKHRRHHNTEFTAKYTPGYDQIRLSLGGKVCKQNKQHFTLYKTIMMENKLTSDLLKNLMGSMNFICLLSQAMSTYIKHSIISISAVQSHRISGVHVLRLAKHVFTTVSFTCVKGGSVIGNTGIYIRCMQKPKTCSIHVYIDQYELLLLGAFFEVWE